VIHRDQYGHVSAQFDRILKGEKLGDLPVLDMRV
jgi:hypothetical protein